MIWVELDGGVCYELGDDSFLLSGVVISGVIRKVTTIITHIRVPITPLITAHEPPSRSFRKLWGVGIFVSL